jgi:hypothetical protein
MGQARAAFVRARGFTPGTPSGSLFPFLSGDYKALAPHAKNMFNESVTTHC